MAIYSLLESIDKRYTFIYITILLVAFFYFRKKSIGLNIIFAVGIGCLIVWYIQDKNTSTLQLEEERRETKFETIRPEPEEIRKYDDILDFVFSIQDFYQYNPPVYEEMIDNLDNFLKVYQYLERGVSECEAYYNIADSKKNNALNALQALIFNLSTNEDVTDKITRAHKRLETILNKYINEMYDICQHDLLKKGYDHHRTIINTGPRAANHYFEKDFTYQFY